MILIRYANKNKIMALIVRCFKTNQYLICYISNICMKISFRRWSDIIVCILECHLCRHGWYKFDCSNLCVSMETFIFTKKVCLTYFEKSEKTSGVQRGLLHVGIPPISPQLIHLSFLQNLWLTHFEISEKTWREWWHLVIRPTSPHLIHTSFLQKLCLAYFEISGKT